MIAPVSFRKVYSYPQSPRPAFVLGVLSRRMPIAKISGTGVWEAAFRYTFGLLEDFFRDFRAGGTRHGGGGGALLPFQSGATSESAEVGCDCDLFEKVPRRSPPSWRDTRRRRLSAVGCQQGGQEDADLAMLPMTPEPADTPRDWFVCVSSAAQPIWRAMVCTKAKWCANDVHWCARRRNGVHLVCIGVQKNGVVPLRAPHQIGKSSQ
jgi:hypothetical protein